MKVDRSFPSLESGKQVASVNPGSSEDYVQCPWICPCEHSSPLLERQVLEDMPLIR